MRIEYFINGFHQPGLSHQLGHLYRAQEHLPSVGDRDISPFLQSYKYCCVGKKVVESKSPTLVGFTKETTILIHLEPQDEFAKKVFIEQYGNREGDFSYLGMTKEIPL